MKNKNNSFSSSHEMLYANTKNTKKKYLLLLDRLKEYLKDLKPIRSLTYNTVYIPDLHGDFVHLILTLHKYGLLDKNLNLKKSKTYVFLGDFYDRSPKSIFIDFWLNIQIRNKATVIRLIGNHELAFFNRDEEGYPKIFPSQDSIKDVENNFILTENLLHSIAAGSLTAMFVEKDDKEYISYSHSYISNDDFQLLGLVKDSDIFKFAEILNLSLKTLGEKAYNIFLESRKGGKIRWGEIAEIFNKNLLFNSESIKNEINTSFLWRRTGIPTLKIYPSELSVEIPDNVFQIVGHTPVFLFRSVKNENIYKPFVIPSSNPDGTGKIQFSDVGVGYYYKEDDFNRPDVFIDKEFNKILK